MNKYLNLVLISLGLIGFMPFGDRPRDPDDD